MYMYPKSTECVYQAVIKYTGAGVQGVFNGLVHKYDNKKIKKMVLNILKMKMVVRACVSVCDFCTHLLLLCMVVPVFILYLREAASALSSFINLLATM